LPGKLIYIFAVLSLFGAAGLLPGVLGPEAVWAAEIVGETETEAQAVRIFYAAPEARGTGDGSDLDNAAYFRDAALWAKVRKGLEESPVTVYLAPGQYIFSKLPKDGKSRETLQLTNIGHPEHQLVVQGLHPEGTVFTTDPTEPIREDLSTGLLVFNGTNAVFRYIHFTGQQHMGYATRFLGKNVLIENCSFTDMINTYYGASGTANADSSFIIWKDCYFRRVGLDSHAHMIYNAYDPQHIYIINCHFEDSSGDYVRFRDNTDYGVVYGSTFISTGTYKGNRPFISVPLFNDDDPAKPGPNPNYEYFGTHMLIAGNTFIYPDDNSAGTRQVFNFLHSGFDPPGRHHLLSPQDARLLITGTVEEKRAFMLENLGIDGTRVFFSDNIVKGRNVENSVYYVSYPSYGALSRGWSSPIDITDAVVTTPVVHSAEEAMAFWPNFIESQRRFAAPRQGDTISQAQFPIRIKTPAFALASVEVTLDGGVIYAGEEIPADLMLEPAKMTVGKHQLGVTLRDADGKNYDEQIDIFVEHVQISPALSVRNVVRGLLPLSFSSYISPDDMQAVTVALVPVIDAEKGKTYELHAGTALIDKIALDTKELVDGLYDLVVNITTKYGITSTTSQRLLIDNWEQLEDELLPPTPNSWFGPRDRLLVTERSTGWEFASENPDLYFGDTDRLRLPGGSTAAGKTQAGSTPTGSDPMGSPEYLVWTLANLQRYSFTLYARNSDAGWIGERIGIAASADGEAWTELPYEVAALEQNSAGLWRLQVYGMLPSEQLSMRFLRFTLTGDPSGPEGDGDGGEIELGHVFLEGIKF